MPSSPADSEAGREELRLLKAPETAALLGISQRTLWSLTASGEIPHVRIRRSVRYAVADLEAWIEARKESNSFTSSPEASSVLSVLPCTSPQL